MPRTFTSRYSSRVRAFVSPATCTMAPAPAAARARSAGLSSPPAITSTGRPERSAGSTRRGSRARSRTAQPSRDRARATWAPTKPVPPVRSAVRIRGIVLTPSRAQDSIRPIHAKSLESPRFLRGHPAPAAPGRNQPRGGASLPSRRRIPDRGGARSHDQDPQGPRAPDLAKPVGGHGLRAAVSHVPERVQEQPLDVHAGVRRATAGRRGRRQTGRLGLDRRLVDEDGLGRRAPDGRPLHPARRQRSRRPDRSRRAAADPRGAAGLDRSRDRLRGQAAEDLRPHGLRARLLPGRPVVPEDRRVRAGRDARAQVRGLELPRLPRETPSSTPTTGTSTSR